jgi:hypothetical protein
MPDMSPEVDSNDYAYVYDCADGEKLQQLETMVVMMLL